MPPPYVPPLPLHLLETSTSAPMICFSNVRHCESPQPQRTRRLLTKRNPDYEEANATPFELHSAPAEKKKRRTLWKALDPLRHLIRIPEKRVS
ncbi:MAG: uncharacterized protein KVP18_001356 [Porospora cf. gigantea A]|uniref:uncharacterized protein n=1 Tax=Porospora cf. gigantea A TaxID=2853593 RepID=UPI0035599CEF|nr:MAG: hypothetical protein KVP18_001356 [Porospora cf. gigantea A]